MFFMLFLMGTTIFVGLLILARLWSWFNGKPATSFPSDGLLRRELGLLESMFYLNAEKNGNLLLANAFFVVSKEKLSVDIFPKALARLARRHPLLRCRVVNKDNVRPFFEEMTDYKTPFSVSDFADWKEEYEYQLMTPYRSGKEPLWRVAFVEKSDNSYADTEHPYQYTFVFGFRHEIIDGSSYVRLIDEFLGDLEDLHNNPHVGENGEGHQVISQSMPPALDEIMPKPSSLMYIVELLLQTALRISTLRKLVANFVAKKIPRNPWILACGAEIDRNPEAEIKTTLIPMTFSEVETRALLTACKTHQVTVQAAVQIAVAVAVTEMVHTGNEFPEKFLLKIPVTANTRNIFPDLFKDHLHHMAPYLGGFNIETFVSNKWKDEFWSLARHVYSHLHETTRQQNLKTYSIMRIIILIFKSGIDFLPLRQKDHGRMDTYAVFTNLGNCNNLSQKSGIVKVAGRFGSSAEHNAGHIFANNLMTVNKRLFWTVTYYPNITSKETTQIFADKVKRIILFILKKDK